MIFCRFCHHEAQPNSPSIFVVTMEFGIVASIAEIAHLLYSVNYERNEHLPGFACAACLELLHDLYDHRMALQERERSLQAQLKKFYIENSQYRPGLNGNPGVFEPESDCEIISVNPLNFVSSSDEDEENDEEEESDEGEEGDEEEDGDDEEEDDEEEKGDEEEEGDQEEEMPLAMKYEEMPLVMKFKEESDSDYEGDNEEE